MSALPVLIIGAGISGLLLAQHLKKERIPFEIFERDTSLTARKTGWGVTLHWAIDPLQSLLPDDLRQNLPYAYADRVSVEKYGNKHSPYLDLSTGEAINVASGTGLKVRVNRKRLRALLATGLDIQWNKSFQSFVEDGDTTTVTFDDGSTRTGCLLVGCDGASSRVRRKLHPQDSKCYSLPIHVFGLTLSCTPEQCRTMREINPFFFSGTASKNNSYLYLSILDSPENNENGTQKYTLQLAISWHPELVGRDGQLVEFPVTQAERYDLIQELANAWTEPFQSFARGIPKHTDIQPIILQDYIPPSGFRHQGRATLLGDAAHAMAMYRGEGANHAIYDVFEFSRIVTPCLHNGEMPAFRSTLDQFEDDMVRRTRPAVMASRRACLDAHDWNRINKQSPLFMKREVQLYFDEKDME